MSTPPKLLVQAGYNSIAPAYQSFITGLPSPNIPWTTKLLSNLPAPSTSRVLELGCGPGVPCTKYLAERVRHVLANDCSTAQIDLAKQNLSACGNVSFMLGDMASLDLTGGEGNGDFDGVVALYSLQHLPRDEQPAMLRRIYAWLKVGGLLLCNFDENEEPGVVMEDWLGARMFHSGFGAEGSREMMVNAGFEMLEAEVVRSVEGKKTVPFLWMLARKG